MRVLVVDPSREQRAQIVLSLCELTNVVVVGAVGGVRSALYALAESTPDVLVMAGDDGPELIAATQRCMKPPDVIVFGDATTEDRCIDAGAEHFVPTSAGLAALQRAVSTTGHQRRRKTPAMERFAQLGRISAAAAHDLRNYLGAAGLALARLEKGMDQESLNTLRLALGSANTLTASMLAYAHGSVPDRRYVDLALVTRNTIAMFERMLPEAIVVQSVIEAVPLIHGVASELEQLVLNLVFNAVDEMPGGGSLGVTLRATDTHLVLEVAQIGAEFAGGSRPPPLGLGIARDVAGRHDARLKITTLPSGSQVSVELPIK